MDLLKGILSSYYTKADLILPDDFPLREFAFQTYKEGVYVRHLSFNSLAVLRDYLIKKTPRQAYYSSALYRDPAAERMEDKGWLGSELLFDIDADHIKGCDKIELKINGKVIALIKPSCIELAKEHELRLLDILKNDFGFSQSEIRIQFSGNRGFHTIVRPKDKEWLLLEPHHRREIVDYIKGIGLSVERLLPRIKNVKFSLDDVNGGWLRRFKKFGEVDEYLIDQLVVEIDEQVTQDISRLIRIPGSINGKLGLPALILNGESDLIRFKYDADLSPFNLDYAIVRLKYDLPKKLEFLGEEYILGLKGDNVRVPLHLAVFLALNDIAEIVKIM